MSDFRWLIEAPGPKYLAVQRLSMSDNFIWTANHDDALAFRSKDQADALMMAVRQMDRDLQSGCLFAFERHLGNAKPIEHAWIDGGAEQFGKRLGGMLSEAADNINNAR